VIATVIAKVIGSSKIDSNLIDNYKIDKHK